MKSVMTRMPVVDSTCGRRTAPGSKWNLTESHRVEYSFTVEEEGYYRIKGGVYAPNDNDDSFYVKLDGQPSGGYLWDVQQNSTYAADYVSNRGGEDPVEVCLTAGTHTVAVYLREDGTRLDTIGLELARSGSCGEPPPLDGLEAEDASVIGGDFEIGNDPNASGGQYVWAPNGSGSKWNLNESHRVEYSFDAEQEGYYRIKGGVYAPNDNDDSFYVKLDGQPSGGYLWDVQQNSTYAADYVSNRDREDPVEVCLAAGTHTVAVYLREDGTRLDTIGLELARSGRCGEPPPLDGLEAEDASVIGGDFEIGSDPEASGGQYVWAPNGSGSKWNLNESHRVEYSFDAEQEGYYRIKGGVYAPNDNDDSFYVKLDGQPSGGYLWDVQQNSTYASDYVSDRDKEDPVEVCLTAGTHTVAVYLREDGTRLDTIGLEFVRSGSCGEPPPTDVAPDECDTLRIYEIGSDPPPNGEQNVVWWPNGFGNRWNGPDEHQRVECRFNVEQKGYYRIKGRVYAPNDNDDSFWSRGQRRTVVWVSVGSAAEHGLPTGLRQ